jgi:hypothetical protein
MPPVFAGGACGFVVAGACAGALEVSEGAVEAAGVGFALEAVFEVAAEDCPLSEVLDCGDCAINTTVLTKNADPTSRARASIFVLRFIIMLLTEMCAHWNSSSLEFRHDGEENR